MSPRKLTEDDKQEILQLYRDSEATTSTLAERYEVSSSTISRFLKNKLSSTEYEDLIQQKRLARTPRGETTAKAEKETKTKKKTVKAKKTSKKSPSKNDSDSKAATEKTVAVSKLEPSEIIEPAISELEATKAESSSTVPKRRRRRRSSANDEAEALTTSITTEAEILESDLETEESLDLEPEEKPAKLVIDTKVKEANAGDELNKPSKNNLILRSDKLNSDVLSDDEDNDDDDDENEMDLITLKEMLGEDLEDINDEEDDEDDDDWDDDEEATPAYSQKDSKFSDLEILPLSQATFPRTCYLVIDRSAELIVKPLAEFADLGEIPQDEVRQKTLPVFDNHRIAKRFSHRRERVIKVPDGRILQKTSHYLQEKGITRLLIDGQIYSLVN